MKRRDFLKSGALTATALPVLGTAHFITTDNKSNLEKIKPPMLKEGDTIGIITPGSSIDEDELQDSIKNLEELGLKPYYTNNMLAKNAYLGGTDKQRADDINHMFANDNVDGIFCARGGYGCNRILPMIDYEMIKRNPKILGGYSDITALLYAITSQTGVVTFHAPVGISTFNEYSIDYIRKVLMSTKSPVELISAEEDEEREDEAYHKYVITSGTAEGELIGGNLSIAASLLGTPYDLDYKDKIVFLEDIGEEPYRIDRMLTELLLAGKLQEAAGIVLGVFVDCEVDEEEPSYSDSFTLKEVMFDRLQGLGIPVVYGLSFGHIKNKFTLPVGIKTKLDVDSYKLTLLESSVINQ